LVASRRGILGFDFTVFLMAFRFLTALPVYNEVNYVDQVLDEVLQYSPHVLVVDDGSTDGTSDLLASRTDVEVLNHETNRGYGAALRSAFYFAQRRKFDALVTIDCDGQHQPKLIPNFVAALQQADIVSGSRYLQEFSGDNAAPEQRRKINQQITLELNERLGLNLTDAFCGFKAYRTSALAKLHITETGYAMPLQLWVQAAKAELKIIELPVPRIYLDLSRSFGGALDDGETRLAHYREVIDRSLACYARTATAEMLCGLGCGDEVTLGGDAAGCR
jgi:dolichol-phosphate mannosyltransferase